MKNLFYFIAGVLFITLISATTVSIMTVKPAKPISTSVFYGYRASPEQITEKINIYYSKGYVLKEMTSNDYSVIVVMEKY